MATPYAMVPQRLPTLEEMLGGFMPAPGPAPTPGSAMRPPGGVTAEGSYPGALPSLAARLQALGAGAITPFGFGAGPPPEAMAPVPSLSGADIAPSLVQGVDLGAAAAGDPAGAAIGQTIGLAPAFRAMSAAGGAIAGSPPVQALGRALARPAVGVPLALGGSLAATTGETQAPPPSSTPMTRADFDRQNRRLGALPSLSDVVKAAEESVRGSDAYASLVERRATTAAKRMMDEAVAAASARWRNESAQRPALETAEEERLGREYQAYRADLRKQQEDAIKAADERATAMANRPFQERWPLTAGALPFASLGIGTALSAAARMRNAGRFNAQADEIGTGWRTALSEAGAATTPEAQRQAILTAQGLQGSASALRPRHTMEYGPAIGAAEVAQLLPSAVDYASSTPGSPLRRHVTDTMTDVGGVAGRLAQGLGWGLGAAKLGQGAAHVLRPQQTIPQLGPATASAAERYGVPPLPAEPPGLFARLLGGRAPTQGASPASPTPPSTPVTTIGGPPRPLDALRRDRGHSVPADAPVPQGGAFYTSPGGDVLLRRGRNNQWYDQDGHRTTRRPREDWRRITQAPLGLGAAVG